MTIPAIQTAEQDQPTWNRKCRDAVNALIRRFSQQGTTTARPVGPVLGQMYYDTTLGVPIWFNGTVWKNAAGTTV